jgi:hypothetical protein
MFTFRCVMENHSTKHIRQGLMSTDEMCDLYLMYWTKVTNEENEEEYLLEGSNFCQSSGPPSTSWQTLGLQNIPVIESSTLT